MTTVQTRLTHRNLQTLAVGVLGALLFAAAAGIRITAQGPHYDELQPACPTFAWTGHHVELFAPVTVGGIPLMTMPYISALKGSLYGIALRATGSTFSLASWRWYGVLLAATGIALLGVVAARRLAPLPAALMTALLVSDATLLLASRHDHGPAALGFLLRILFIVLWLRSLDDHGTRPRATFLLAAVAGLASFEKIISVVLVVPLVAIVAAAPSARRRHVVAGLAGFTVGVTPLLLVNLLTTIRTGTPLILRSFKALGPQPEIGLVHHLAAYLSLGAGHQFRRFMLGVDWPMPATLLELALAVSVLALAAWRLHSGEPGALRRAGLIALGSYLLIGVLLWLMPRVTWVHNWLVGTPFNYLAVAVALTVPARPRTPRPVRALPLLLVAWLALRLVFLGATASSLARGCASIEFDPSLATLAEFATEHAEDAVFVASGWGTATQIYCYGQGREQLVFEPFWYDDAGARVASLHDRLAGRSVYLVALRDPLGVRPEATAAVVEELTSGPGWRELPVDPRLADLAAVEVRRFEAWGAPQP